VPHATSPLAPRTVDYIHVTLHKAFSQTVSDGLRKRNATPVKAPSPEIKPPSPDQDRKLIKTAHEAGDSYTALYVVALHTGLRWDDVDLEASTPTLQVRRTLSETRTGHKFEFSKIKGCAIKFSQKAVEALRSHRARQAEEKLRLGISLAGQWARLLDHHRHDHERYEPAGAVLQAATQAGGTPGHPATRPPAYLRYNTPHGRQASQVRPGDVRTRQHLHAPRRVLARHRGAWTVGSETLWTRPSNGLLLPHCCHWGSWLSPNAEKSA
jgi:hypothetical protein